MSETAIPDRYKTEHKDCSITPVPSKTWIWDKERLAAMQDFAKRLIEELGTAEAMNAGYRRMLYDDLGCRESCMGWVNERAENAEAKVAQLAADKETVLENNMELRSGLKAVTERAEAAEAKVVELLGGDPVPSSWPNGVPKAGYPCEHCQQASHDADWVNLEDQVKAFTAMLKRLEWGDTDHLFDELMCLVCLNLQSEGHANNCELKRLLEVKP